MHQNMSIDSHPNHFGSIRFIFPPHSPWSQMRTGAEHKEHRFIARPFHCSTLCWTSHWWINSRRGPRFPSLAPQCHLWLKRIHLLIIVLKPHRFHHYLTSLWHLFFVFSSVLIVNEHQVFIYDPRMLQIVLYSISYEYRYAEINITNRRGDKRALFPQVQSQPWVNAMNVNVLPGESGESMKAIPVNTGYKDL